MHTFTKELTIRLNVNFSENEFKEMLDKYKRDCKEWHLDPNDIDNLEIYLDENYAWDLNEYTVRDSDNNIYEVYNEAKKFL